MITVNDVKENLRAINADFRLLPADAGAVIPVRVFWFVLGALCLAPIVFAFTVHALRADAMAEATVRLQLDWRDAIAVCTNAGGVAMLDPHTVRPTCAGGSFRRKPLGTFQ